MNQAVKWTTLRFLTLAVIAGGAVVGCETPVKPKPQAPVPSFALPPTRAASVAVLIPTVAKFDQDISMFPGVTGADHRRTLAMALDELDKILRLINGPTQSPGFTADLSIINACQKTASMQSIPRERMIAVENQALQAVVAALNELSTRYLLDKDVLPGLLDTLNTKVTNAAGVEGTMHDLDATDCFSAVAAVVGQMTSDLKAMVGDQTSGPMAPSPQEQPTPVVPPAATPVPPTAPTTSPATAPAPMPAPAPTP
jgi:hypothetical protein